MKYLLRRIGFYLFTAWAAITINFFIPRLIPGDPVLALIAKFQGQLSTKAIQSLYVLFGLDKHENVCASSTGTTGCSSPTATSACPSRSSRRRSPRCSSQSLPWTIALVGITTLVSFLLGTGLGVLAGWRRGSWVDALLPVTTFFSSVPYFWLGLIAITLLAGAGSFFPSSGGYDPGVVPGLDRRVHRQRHPAQPAAGRDDPASRRSAAGSCRCAT